MENPATEDPNNAILGSFVDMQIYNAEIAMKKLLKLAGDLSTANEDIVNDRKKN